VKKTQSEALERNNLERKGETSKTQQKNAESVSNDTKNEPLLFVPVDPFIFSNGFRVLNRNGFDSLFLAGKLKMAGKLEETFKRAVTAC